MLGKRHLWLPYAGFILLIVGLSLAGVLESFFTRSGIVALLLAASGGGVLLLQASYLIRPGPRERKLEAGFSLLAAGLVIIVFLVIADRILPPPPPRGGEYDHTRKSLRGVFQRRDSRVERDFREAEIRAGFNALGWADRERDYRPGRRPVVFLGDSFLEWKNSQRLAELTAELLAAGGREVEIVNLSKDDTDPPQYRHRFYEFALELEPEHIFFFIFGGNDLDPDYRYRPYRHPEFALSRRAEFLLCRQDLPAGVKARARALRKRGEVFSGKEDLLSEFEEFGLSPLQENLIYLVVYAYSGEGRGRFPLFSDFFSTLGEKLEEGIQSLVLLVRSPRLWRRGRYIYPHHHPGYAKIFQLPEEARLEEIAGFIGRYYLPSDEGRSCLNRLREQGEEFGRYLAAEPDDTLYLMTALREGGGGDNSPDPEKLAEAAGEYLELFRELEREARSVGSGFTVVLIPEASAGDEEFYRFWLPLCDFRDYFADRHALYRQLSRELKGKIPVIDLGEYPDRLLGGYYLLDGHWNDRGNRTVADLLADYLRDYEGQGGVL